VIKKIGTKSPAIYCDNCKKNYRRKYSILVFHEARDKGWYIEPYKNNWITICPTCVSKIIKEFLIIESKLNVIEKIERQIYIK